MYQFGKKHNIFRLVILRNNFRICINVTIWNCAMFLVKKKDAQFYLD